MSTRFMMLFFCSFCTRCLPVFSQQLFLQKYPLELHEGSVQNSGITQDHQGIIYIANTDGVLIYDGTHWDLIRLPNMEYVLALEVDNTGRVYVGSYKEFGYLQKDIKGKYQYHSLMRLLTERNRESVKEVTSVQIFGNAVFFNDDKRCYIYENKTLRILNEENIKLVELNGIVYALKNEELFVYKDSISERARFYPESNDVQWIVDYTDSTCLILDYENRLWILDVKSGASKRPFSDNLNKKLKTIYITNLRVLTGGRLAILTAEEILIVGVDGRILFTITSEMLGGDLATKIFFEDKHRNLWFSTNEFLGMLTTSSPLAFYDRLNGLNGTMYSLGVHEKSQYVGTDKGLYYRKSKDTFSMIPGTEGEIWNLYNHNKKVYVAHSNGVFEVQDRMALKIVDHNYVHSLCTIRKHPECMIMGTYNTGIWLVKKQGSTWHKKKIEGFEEETRFLQEDPEGNIWIAHYSKGIWKLRLNNEMDSVISKSFYDSRKGLPSNLDNRVYKLSDQNIIALTNDGIYRYNTLQDRFEPDQRFYKFLNKTIIHTVAESREGNIAFRGRTTQGKAREFTGTLNKKQTGIYELLLTPFEKLTWMDSEAPVLFVNDDELWTGNNTRLISYNPANVAFFTDTLKPYIKKVVTGNSTYYTALEKQSNIEFPYKENSINIDYDVSYYEDSEKIEYQHKLVGLEKDWSAWTTVSEASFINLPEGSYTFQVRAKNVYESESLVASFEFYIAPPIYRTLPAYMLYVLLFGLVVYLLTVINTKRINRQKEVLEKEVNEKTKELLAVNEEIMAQNEEILNINEAVHCKNIEIECQAKVLRQSNLTKDKLFSIISHDLRGPVHQLREIFKMIDLGYISVDDFQQLLIPQLKERVSYVADLTDNLLHWAKDQMEGIQVRPSTFNLQTIVDENINLLSPQAKKKGLTLVLSGNIDCPVYVDKDMTRLVLRNLMSNAIKFTSKRSEIVIGVVTDHTYIYVSVSDKGTGLTAEEIDHVSGKVFFTKYGTSGEKGSGLGLMLCQEFIEKNGGTLIIKSTPGEGSTFTFTIPLRNT